MGLEPKPSEIDKNVIIKSCWKLLELWDHGPFWYHCFPKFREKRKVSFMLEQPSYLTLPWSVVDKVSPTNTYILAIALA